MLLQIEKAPETSDGDLICYVLNFENALAHLGVIENIGADCIITIEKKVLWCHVILLPFKGAKKFFVVSLIDPFFVDCIIFEKDTTYYSTSKFHDIHGTHRLLWWFYVCRL